VTVQGVTFDTGMLFALERRKQSAWNRYRRIQERGAAITIPTVVLGEWWRGRTDIREALVASARVEPLSAPIARLAGEALAKVKGATAIDAFVMASVALRGDVVYTSDLDDLTRLTTFFPGVRVLGV
jgi:hypothetical protein